MTKELASFNYGNIDPQTKISAEALAEDFQTFRRRTTADTVALGKRFATLKKSMDHGLWETFVEVRCEASTRVVQYMMAIAGHFGDQPSAIAKLSVTQAITLCAKRTPSELRDQVLRADADGKAITSAELDGLLPSASPRKPKTHQTIDDLTQEELGSIKTGLKYLDKSARRNILAFLETLGSVPLAHYLTFLRHHVSE